MLKPTESQMEEYNRLPVTTDMEEHCANLERFGATYFTDATQCEEARIVTASISRASQGSS
jgi:hypothetical protein